MKLTAAIATSYFGAEVITPSGIGRIIGVLPHELLLDFGKGTGRYTYDQCHSILTPLSKISDEDAVALCGLVGWDAREAGKIESSGFGTDEKLELNFQFHSYRIKQSVQLIHYCQSHSIDIGHGYGDNHIPSLIAAGVAVDKSTLTTNKSTA